MDEGLLKFKDSIECCRPTSDPMEGWEGRSKETEPSRARQESIQNKLTWAMYGLRDRTTREHAWLEGLFHIGNTCVAWSSCGIP